MIQGRDGNFYGNSSTAFFTMTPEGKLTHTPAWANVHFIQASDGNFYGIQSDNDSASSLVKRTVSGVVTTVATFPGYDDTVYYDNSGDSSQGIIEGRDGNFYCALGSSTVSSDSNYGRVFRVTPAGVTTALVTFHGINGGALLGNPGSGSANLLQESNGDIYGTTAYGGAGASPDMSYYGAGTLFKITATGDFSSLYSFRLSQGSTSVANLVEGADGNFYGTTSTGGVHDGGTVFKVTPAGQLATLHSFDADLNSGSNPAGALSLGQDGNFYGITSMGPSNFYSITPEGKLDFITNNNKRLYFVDESTFSLSNDGNYYGLMNFFGQYDLGALFELSTTGQITTLASLRGPSAGSVGGTLTKGLDGNFYGIDPGGKFDSGEVFKLTPKGLATTLVSFKGADGDANGNIAEPPLLLGQDGSLYGTTYYGGTYDPDFGFGTVFKVSPDGALTSLASFSETNGANPNSALVQDRDGNLYGTTQFGGSPYVEDDAGDGTIFRLTPNGDLSALEKFSGAKGTNPNGVIIGRDGNLYGTTQTGGTANAGVVFEFDLAGPAQNIIFTPITGATYQQTQTLSATVRSGLPISYSVLSGPATISGDQITFTGTGRVVVAADQSGDGSHKAAPQVRQTVMVGPAAQTITPFDPIPDQTYGTSVTFTPPTASSGLHVTVYVRSGWVTISGNRIKLLGVGRVELEAYQAGTAHYLEAKPVFTSFVVRKSDQSITFPKVESGFTGQTVTLAATASSGLPVYYSVLEGPATVYRNQLTFTGPGVVKLAANQQGNDGIKAASQVRQDVKVYSQSISFPPLGDQVYGASIQLSAVASSGLPVTYKTQGPIKVMGNTLVMTGVGPAAIGAYQGGDASLGVAREARQTFTVRAAPQAITFSAIGDKVLGGGTFALAATSSSGLPITYAAFGKATVSGNVVTLTGVGPVRITADQAGDADYLAARTVTQRFSVIAAP